MKNIIAYIVLVVMLTGTSLSAQEANKAIHEAMEQEVARNLKNLHLPGMKDPFYIGLNIADINLFSLHSSLGALIKVNESPNRVAFNNQLLVGDYQSNNLNFSSSRASSNYSMLPQDNSVQEIRRRLWMTFDRGYKLSAELYESKQSALKSKTQEDDITNLPDFTPGEKVSVVNPEISLKFEVQKLTAYANAVSEVFKSYKSLSGSWVRLVGYKANVYFSNSEGTKASYPTSVIRLVVEAEAQAANGEVFELYNIYHALSENDLPLKEQVIKDAQILAENLQQLKEAPIFNDVYNGPVLFEGQAAGEVVRKTMFYARNENLCAVRKQVTGNSNMNTGMPPRVSADDRIDKKIAADGLSVIAKPEMTSYNGISLVGAYPIDMEGVVPNKEIKLIENGILKNLLCSRIPTAKMKQSNGHLRVSFQSLSPMIVPGVVDVDFAGAVSKDELKRKLIEIAKAEGLDYALIVRNITPNLSELKLVFRVDIKTGEEKLIRTTGFKGLTLNDLRKIVGAGNLKVVLNTSAGEDLAHKFDYPNGCPATFITPDAFLFKEIEVNKATKPNMAKIPAVKNPLEL